MRRTAFSLLLLSTVLLAAACSGRTFITEATVPPAGGTVLAVMPPDFHSRAFNDAFERAFVRMGMKQVLHPGELAKRLKLTSYVHERVRSAGNKDGLKELLGEKHFTFLMTSLSPATVVLIPTEMKLTSSSLYTYGDFTFRVYDCATGRLLYRNSFQERTGSRGIRAEQELARSSAERMAREVRALFRVPEPLR